MVAFFHGLRLARERARRPSAKIENVKAPAQPVFIFSPLFTVMLQKVNLRALVLPFSDSHMHRIGSYAE
jgi:hypothetical protein